MQDVVTRKERNRDDFSPSAPYQIMSHDVQVHRKQAHILGQQLCNNRKGTGIIRAQATDCQGCCDSPGGSRRKSMGLEDQVGESAEATTNRLFDRNV